MNEELIEGNAYLEHSALTTYDNDDTLDAAPLNLDRRCWNTVLIPGSASIISFMLPVFIQFLVTQFIATKTHNMHFLPSRTPLPSGLPLI
jgi:hypothetical protein